MFLNLPFLTSFRLIGMWRSLILSAIIVCIVAFEVSEANMGLHGCINNLCAGAVCTLLPVSKLQQENHGFLPCINTQYW